MEFGIHWDALMDALPKAMIGWLGVFVVTAVIILSVWVLNKVSGKKN